MDNLVKQTQEILSLRAIYGKEWRMESYAGRMYSVRVVEGCTEATLYLQLAEDYPTHSPPMVEISAPSLSRDDKVSITEALNAVYLENIGQTVIFQWVELVRSFLQELQTDWSFSHKIIAGQKGSRFSEKSALVTSMTITHGDVIEDRRSVFQAHVVKINKPADVDAFLKTLKEERKIASAKHNVVAWRCGAQRDYDDDGERSAGGRLAKLLELVKADNVAVAVTRWYGGIQIGADRFRHYNNAARQALVQAKIIRK